MHHRLDFDDGTVNPISAAVQSLPPMQAFKCVLALPEPMRRNYIGMALSNLARADPEGTIRLIRKSPVLMTEQNNRAVKGLVYHAPEMLAANFDAVPEKKRERAARDLAGSLYIRDPEKAWEWIISLEQKTIRDSVIGGFVRASLRSPSPDFLDIISKAQELGGGQNRSSVIVGIYSTWVLHDPDKAFESMEGSPLSSREKERVNATHERFWK